MGALLKDGTRVEDSRLARIPLQDDRSRNFQVRDLLDTLPPEETTYRWWMPGPTLDQGREGQCVAESTTDARNGSPVRTKPAMTAFADRKEYYHELQHADPWRGCSLGAACPIDPDAADAYEGTAVLTGAQEGKRRGWWKAYRWLGAGSGTLEQDLVETLTRVGGVVFGIDWLDGMYSTSPSGLVEVSGSKVGGHAIHGWEWAPRQRMPKHWSGTKPGVWWHNSWGPSYGVSRRGVSGCGFVLLEELLGLLERPGGEGMVPVER